jgi:type VI secretion system secreted protein Hcp
MSHVISSFPKLWQHTRKRWWWAALLAVYLMPFFVFPGFGAFDTYLKIESIPGESRDTVKHKDWIEIESFSFGMSRTASLPGGQAGMLKLDSVSVRKSIDKSSPILMLKTCIGENIPEAVLEYQKTLPTGEDAVYLKIKMSDLLVSGYSLSGGGGGGSSLPVDSLSLNFTKIEMTYIPYDDAGNPLEPVTAQCDFTQAQ